MPISPPEPDSDDRPARELDFAATADTAASNAVFAHTGELAETERQLAAIETAISAAAEPERPTPAD